MALLRGTKQSPSPRHYIRVGVTSRGIPFEPQKELRISYKDHRLEQKYKADFLGYGKIIVVIFVLDRLTSREEAQLLNYFLATGLEVGVLINFGSDGKLKWKQRVLTHKPSANPAKPQNEF
jgi:GxxExxY protein